MGYVFVIFGSLIALNFGFGVKMSDATYSTWDAESRVEVEAVENTPRKQQDGE
ncbi:MAG: hypothetical protein VYA55_17600 [Pseudomonadota bacterium]|nr:hypothetical protein [Pseudomonadota bacterium]